jgi:hypothetical protein
LKPGLKLLLTIHPLILFSRNKIPTPNIVAKEKINGSIYPWKSRLVEINSEGRIIIVPEFTSIRSRKKIKSLKCFLSRKNRPVKLRRKGKKVNCEYIITQASLILSTRE